MAKFAIKDIRFSEFRHMERYPIRRDKVEALRSSMRTTSFWDNIVARPKDGEAEIAYGHHRLIALQEEYGPDREVDLIIRNLSDEIMLKIMAQENMEEWGTNASIEHETIRAVVEAYAEGKIRLREIDPKIYAGQVRYAPSFIIPEEVSHVRNLAYSGQTVAEFLGWLKPDGRAQDKVYSALSALQFIEEKILKESNFEGLTTKQAQAVVEQARRARAERETVAKLAAQRAEQARKEAAEADSRRQQAEAEAAKTQEETAKREAEERARQAGQEVRAAQRRATAETKKEKEEREKARQQATAAGKIVSEELKAGRIAIKQAPEAAAKVIEKREGPIPDIDQFAERLAKSLHEVLDPEKDIKRVENLKEMVKFKDNIRPDVRIDLIKTLYLLASRATGFAQQLGGTEYPKLTEGGK